MLAALLNEFSEPKTQDTWAFDHADQHNKIIDASFQKYGIVMEPFILDPMALIGTPELTNWLENHQAATSAYESLLGIAGNDLSEVDFTKQDQVDSWLRLHWFSHQQAQQKLGFPD